MTTVRIFLRGGSRFDITAEEFTTRRDRISNQLNSLSWTDAVSGKPLYLRLDAVDAVVPLDETEGDGST
ncbi:hypothetical protein [Streptomyces sp. NBC_00687]|uniref:hypothetical protein n=1 Tax=Streptomyces sp. NBC_00687 TaxID=2975807 RepID=UPI002257DA1D|nr:hypothetical protein [Streptomyces sp. NBC_00687]MCX4912848.1 hypothetical protein [Streptomyces sp. NBC_00687]